MLKIVGGLTLAAAAVIGAAAYFGWADFAAEAKLTQKGKAEVQSVRNDVADVVRGQSQK